MKKLLAFLLLAVLLFSLSGCARVDPVKIAERLSQTPLPVPGNKISYALSLFACNTIPLLMDGSGNFCFSPASLYYLLALNAAGSNGIARQALLDVMALTGFGSDAVDLVAGELSALQFSYGDQQLSFANALFLNDDYSYLSEFSQHAAVVFYASLYSCDFSDADGTAAQMRQWAEENTGGLISPSYRIDDDLILFLMNTLFFKDAWAKTFDAENNAEGTFACEDGTTAPCIYMNQRLDNSRYLTGDGFSGMTIDFCSAASITLILPDKGVPLSTLVSSPGAIAAMLNPSSERADVILKLPKTEFGCEFDLIPLLDELGLLDVLNTPDGGFAEIFNGEGRLGSARQLTYFILDEEGVEAAAYTEETLIPTASQDPAPKRSVYRLEFDRPFLFYITIQDAFTGNKYVLFFGTVANPAE